MEIYGNKKHTSPSRETNFAGFCNNVIFIDNLKVDVVKSVLVFIFYFC